MPRIWYYIPKSHEQLVKRFEQLVKQDGSSPSRIVCQLIFEWVKQHEPGNPQQPLLPAYEKPLYVVSNFPMQRRSENVEWLESLILRNPGFNEVFWMHKFSHLCGVRPETVAGYLKMLLTDKTVIRQGGKLYHKNSVQTRVEEAES